MLGRGEEPQPDHRRIRQLLVEEVGRGDPKEAGQCLDVPDRWVNRRWCGAARGGFGEPVIRADLSTGPLIGSGEVAITIPVEAGSVFPGLRLGDALSVSVRREALRRRATVTLLERTVVYDVSLERSSTVIGRDGEDSRGLGNLTLVVGEDEAEQLAHSWVRWTVTVALLLPDGGEAAG